MLQNAVSSWLWLQCHDKHCHRNEIMTVDIKNVSFWKYVHERTFSAKPFGSVRDFELVFGFLLFRVTQMIVYPKKHINSATSEQDYLMFFTMSPFIHHRRAHAIDGSRKKGWMKWDWMRHGKNVPFLWWRSIVAEWLLPLRSASSREVRNHS